MGGVIQTIEDPTATGGHRYKRIPRNEQEETLVRYGWTMQGLSLLSHPSEPHVFYSLEEALDLFHTND
jgi:hypothetical protein